MNIHITCIRFALIGSLSIGGMVYTQNLPTAWENYLSVNRRMEQSINRQELWMQQQVNLRENIQSLQEGKSWYNGWLNEMRIISQGADLATLGDSLASIQETISNLQQKRIEAFGELKSAYHNRLMELESTEGLTRSEKEEALVIGNWILDQTSKTEPFPDYYTLLDGTYENEDVRRLVILDLRRVLDIKLGVIDSLLVEKELERSLLQRLNDFHRDLSYLEETNLDVGIEREPTVGWSAAMEGPNDDASSLYSEAFGVRLVEGQKRSLESSSDGYQLYSSERGLQPAEESLEPEITRLQLKRAEYQDLLRRILAELSP